MKKKSKKFLLLAAAVSLALLAAAGVYGLSRPEVFVKTPFGRAAAVRLARIGFVRSYLSSRPEILITPRNVGILLRETGMDDIGHFRLQLEAGGERLGWDSLSPERKSRYFEGLYDVERLPYTIAFLMAMPEEHRRELVDFVAGHARDYRVNMTAEEAAVLSARVKSPGGRRMLAESQRYYLTRLTPEQMQAIGPIVDEIVMLTTGMLK